LDHLGIERAHFVGYSSGGMSLLFVGTRHQARARTLTLVSATYTFDDHAKPVMRERADAREAAARADPENQQQRGPYFQELTDAFRGFTLGPPELPFTPDDLRQITVPVLILHGDRDVFFPVYIPVTMYQAMPNAELCIVPVAGHGVPGDPSGLFLTIISQFLARHADA
ncbi:MAG: alpha/beta hydrolase, partial [Anaerolineae bacterium]|nr:alpha/beta hydrolase [Anaerolineae bacterium]